MTSINPDDILFRENQQLEIEGADRVVKRKIFNRENFTAVGPSYTPVSSECQSSIDFTSSISGKSETIDDDIFADQMCSAVPAVDMEVKTFMMWTNERPNASEQADADFASTCNWVFGHVKGILKEKTMIVIIGQLFEDDDKPAPTLGHKVIITPESFLMPSGLNNESAVNMLADFNTTDSDVAAKLHANKRQRVQLTTSSRSSSTSQGESSIFLQDIDGNNHQTREKKDISKREKELGPMWRLLKGRENHIMGRDCVLQISEYKQNIMDESINQIKDTTSEYSDSSLVRQLTAHSIVKDDKYLKMFLRANFGTDSTTSLSFSSFLSRPFLPGTLPSYTARLEYTQAAASFEVAARVFYSKEFVKVMDPILLILSGPLDLLSLVSDDLLLWTIERTFTKWGKAVRTDVTSTEFPTIALGTPTGCARLLTSMLTADLMLLTGESLFLQERFYRAAIAAQVAISASENSSNPSPTLIEKNPRRK